MARVFNFSAGPATLPEEVLRQAAEEMADWRGTGMSVMEMSHRSREFGSILEAALHDMRELMAVPANYRILFMQGGATAQNAIIPMNLAGRGAQPATADFIHTGIWSGKSIAEAGRYCRVNVAATSERTGFTSIPGRETWRLSDNAAYIHICSNETIHGVEYHTIPQVEAPLVADMSSNILSRAVDVSKYGVIFASAQKNIGQAGLTVVIVREDLLGHAIACCPSMFDWSNVAGNDSMFNTPPTYAIYIAGLVFQWMKRQGGISAIERRNEQKASLLYDYLDSTGFYRNPVSKECRSRMNVPFFLHNNTLDHAFVAGAEREGLVQIRGHRAVGGMRASIYNAMPPEGVQALVSYMKEFERLH